MSIFWDERECPINPRDAYYEGRRAREYDRNPYEHGRDAFASHDCEEAYREFGRGQRAAEYDRQLEAEQAAEERRMERRRHERAEEERRMEDYQQQQYEAEINAQPWPEDPGPNPGARNE